MFDSLTGLVLTDGDNRRLRRIDRNGIIETIAGRGAVGEKSDRSAFL